MLQELNAIFSKPLKELLSSETEVDDAAFISIDSKGTDIRVRQGAQVILSSNNIFKPVFGDVFMLVIIENVLLFCSSTYRGYHLRMGMLLKL